jgi:hypothetical protein
MIPGVAEMLRTLFKKAWEVARSILRRVRAINTPWGGVQLSEPAPDLSFARAQDEWELRHEIYLLAGSEAYTAKDSARRLGDLMVPEVQAVENYLAENPETRRWVKRNIEAGTCATAVGELRKRKEEFRQARLAERGDVPRRAPNPEFDWMRQAVRDPRGH